MPSAKTKHVPKHRGPSAAHAARTAPKKVLRSTVIFSSVAVAATAGVVSTGVAASPMSVSNAAELTAQDLADHVSGVDGQVDGAESDAALADRLERSSGVSRSDQREATDPAKVQALAPSESRAVTKTEDLSSADPRDVGRALLPEFGFDDSQFGCLDSLYMSESGWRVDADNPTSSAYGIPQALPGEKMASAGADWATNPETQIRWGLGYIQDTYGSPCSAWAFKQGNGWY
jgi:hypothetical protein